MPTPKPKRFLRFVQLTVVPSPSVKFPNLDRPVADAPRILALTENGFVYEYLDPELYGVPGWKQLSCDDRRDEEERELWTRAEGYEADNQEEPEPDDDQPLTDAGKIKKEAPNA